MVDYRKVSEREDGETGTKSRWWIGCCGGCAAVALLVGIAISVLIYFMVRGRPVVPPETFFRSDADAVMVIQLQPEDEGMVNLLESMAKNPPEELELSERERRRLATQAGDIPKQVRKIAPVQMVMLAHHLSDPLRGGMGRASGKQGPFPGLESLFIRGIGEQKRFQYSLAFSVKAYGGMLAMLMKAGLQALPEQGGAVEHYGETKVGVSGRGILMASVENNFLFTEEADVVHGWIDVLQDVTEGVGDGEELAPRLSGSLQKVYDRLDPNAPMLFCVENDEGEVRDLIAAFKERRERAKKAGDERRADELDVERIITALSFTDLMSDEVVALGGMMRVLDAETAELDIYVDCNTVSLAHSLAGQLRAIFETLVQQYTTMDAESDGNWVHVKIRIDNFAGGLREKTSGS